MSDVWACIADITIHFAHDTDVFITVEERVLVLLHAIASNIMRSLVRLKARIRQNNDQSLRVLVITRDWNVLLGDQLREAGRWQRLRLRSCAAVKDYFFSHDSVLVERRCQIHLALQCRNMQSEVKSGRVAQSLLIDKGRCKVVS